MNLLHISHTGNRQAAPVKSGGERRLLSWRQLLLLVLFCILVPCVAILRSTAYVTVDGVRKVGDEITYVTADKPLLIPVYPSGDNLRSVLLHIASPARSEGGERDATQLQITITDADGVVVARLILHEQENGAGLALTDDPIEIALEEIADPMLPENTDAVTQMDADPSYVILLTSNAESEDAAFYSAQCLDGSIWYRCTYHWMSNGKRLLTETLVGWTALLVLAGLLFTVRRKGTCHVTPEGLFLAASIVVGILYFAILPCMLVPDSSNHFVRAYLLSRGMLVLPEGGQVTIPMNLLPYESYSYSPYSLLHNLNETIDWSNTITYDAVNMALYSPINYLVQAIGILIGSLFTQNTNALQVLASVFNYAACTAILYWAIKKIPYGKAAILALSLVPMAVQERASLSADAITYACVVAMLALCLELREREKPIRRCEYVLLAVLLIAVASCKIVYFVTGFLILLIPTQRFAREGQNVKARALVCKTVGVVILLAFSLGWLAIASTYLGSTRGGGDTAAKMDIILHQPVRYIYILNKTVLNDGFQYLQEMIGIKMGPTNIEISPMVIGMALLVILVSMQIGTRRVEVDRRRLLEALYMAVLVVGMCLLVMTSLYIQWTALGAATYSIEGLQGRYFLPIAPLAMQAVISLLQRPAVENEVNAANAEAQDRALAFAIAAINVLVLIFCWSHSSYIG